MGNTDTQGKEVKVEIPTEPLNPNPTPQPDPAVLDLQRQLDEVKKQITDKDRFIADLSSEKSALEVRLSHTQPTVPVPNGDIDVDTEVARILETAVTDSQTAGKELSNFIRANTEKMKKEVMASFQGTLEPAIDNITYANEIKSKNKDLLDLFGEKVLSIEVQEMLVTNKAKNFREAVDTVVKTYRERMNTIKSNASPTPAPTAAVVETGNNRKPEPTPTPKPETEIDEINRRKKERQLKGL